MQNGNPNRMMLMLCTLILVGACGMLAFGSLALWPARDLEKSVASDREFIARLSAGKVTCSEPTKLSVYAKDTLEYHQELGRAYLELATVFLVSGGVFLILGGLQLVIVRRHGRLPPATTPPGQRVKM